jgi:hypothetical protein
MAMLSEERSGSDVPLPLVPPFSEVVPSPYEYDLEFCDCC